jgi:hypothetical protein
VNDHDECDDNDDDGVTEADKAAAYEALDEHHADQRVALREALTLLLHSGPDAVLAAEGELRHRLSDDGAYALALASEELHPEHDGIYWGCEHEGDFDG